MYARLVHKISKSRSETPSDTLSGRPLLSSMVFSTVSLLGHSGLQGAYQVSQHQHQLKFAARSNLEKTKARGSVIGSSMVRSKGGHLPLPEATEHKDFCEFAYTHHSFPGRHYYFKSACHRRPILTRFPRIPAGIRWDEKPNCWASHLGMAPKTHKWLLLSCS